MLSEMTIATFGAVGLIFPGSPAPLRPADVAFRPLLIFGAGSAKCVGLLINDLGRFGKWSSTVQVPKFADTVCSDFPSFIDSVSGSRKHAEDGGRSGKDPLRQPQKSINLERRSGRRIARDRITLHLLF